jgi:hypothetical protein
MGGGYFAVHDSLIGSFEYQIGNIFVSLFCKMTYGFCKTGFLWQKWGHALPPSIQEICLINAA